MPVSLLCLGERERPVDYGTQGVHGNGLVHRLKVRAAANTDRAECNPTAGQH
jgi:hypothetical protein